MALELEYRGTFIDVKEDPLEGAGSVVRAASAPATYRRTLECDAEVEERQLRGYVGELSQRMEELSEEINQKGVQESPIAEPAAEGNEIQPSQSEVVAGLGGPVRPPPLPYAFSEGGIGHPEVCRRPCVYFNRGFCHSGAACGYCHHQHPDREAKLDKKQRLTLDEITKAQLIALVLHFLRERAEETGMAHEATEVLGIFAEELRFWGGEEIAELESDSRNRKLGKVMARMSFGALLSLASHRLDRDPFQRQLSKALETLRRSV
mmetsp:Transcript_32031/g.74820  ORF Transcript_32031/g.74820 Transcript_32031/m.74820 type:complete len:264 (-) Transcript_32031:143-934(-)